VEVFDLSHLEKIYRPDHNSSGEDNGQVTIIGGSSLFHGAPILSLVSASRIVDMVFFSSPEESLEGVAAQIKGKLSSFIWVPWEEIDEYVAKSDAALIGPGFMRFKSEKTPHGQRYHSCDEACKISRETTQDLLSKYRKQRWVIDAGSLQIMEPDWIPEGAILTPNRKEYDRLFGDEFPLSEDLDDMGTQLVKVAKKYKCILVLKGPKTLVCSEDSCLVVEGGNAGLTKGGTGDVQAGLTVALLAKNEPFWAASAASFIVKYAADKLFTERKYYYNSDDLAWEIGRVMGEMII
jgi:ADP-dependent NAD(P)H-hydrate dehydratase / NAD(P)H-hydrate epimerase